MSESRIILSDGQFNITLQRLAHQLIEIYDDFSDVYLIGIQERGVFLAERLYAIIQNVQPDHLPKFGKLDITFYRDDYRIRQDPLKASSTTITHSVEGQKVILVDDVLYSGRTIQAAMSALQDLGRPAKVELVTMVDRRFNRHLPIEPDYVGITVDALDEAYVRVRWKEAEGKDEILFFSANRNQ